VDYDSGKHDVICLNCQSAAIVCLDLVVLLLSDCHRSSYIRTFNIVYYNMFFHQPCRTRARAYARLYARTRKPECRSVESESVESERRRSFNKYHLHALMITDN